MRILLLSCETGGGHMSAAAAIQSYCEQKNIICDIRNALLFVSKPHSKVISKGHSYVYRHFPRSYGVGYRHAENHPPRFIYEQMSWGAKRFASYVKENHYDAIISVHIFGNMLVTEARKKYGVTIPHYAVNTDYALCPGSDMIDARRTFIAAEQMREAYLGIGLSNDSVITSGIPVREEFFHIPTKQEARRQLHLPEHGKVVLLFTGSIGCGRLHRKAPQLESKLSNDTHFVIICGNNKRLYNRLRKSCGPNTTVLGFTDKVAEYMAAADLCVTKPGGLSVTELMVVGLPMVLLLAVPGNETRNLEHFVGLDVAVGTEDWDEAIALTVQLLNDDKRLEEMRRRLQSIGYPGGAKVVMDTVLQDMAPQEQQKDD